MDINKLFAEAESAFNSQDQLAAEHLSFFDDHQLLELAKCLLRGERMITAHPDMGRLVQLLASHTIMREHRRRMEVEWLSRDENVDSAG